MSFLGHRFWARRASSLVVAAVTALSLTGIALAQQPAAPAAKSAERAPSAPDLVQQALRGQTLGQGDPATLLARALTVDPKSEPARWYNGFVWESGRWVKYDAVADGNDYRQLLDRYETERLAHPDSLEGHWAMADWCGDHNLPMQQRAHLLKVLEFNAEHEGARTKLGYLRYGDAWFTRTEIDAARRHKIDAEKSFKKWSTVLKPLRIAFESGDPGRIAAAREKLAAIRDPDAIPAMETMLARVNLDAASAVVFVIRQMPGPDAAVGLARQAVFADWYPVGKQAAEVLKEYDELSYIPLMLSALSTPPDDRYTVKRITNGVVGRLLVRYEFERERQDRTEKVIYDVSYGVWTYSVGAGGKSQLANMHPMELFGVPTLIAKGNVTGFVQNQVSGPIDTRPYYHQVLESRIARDRAELEGRLEIESRATKELNDRIYRALGTAAAAAAPPEKNDDPRAWWNWWTKRREVFMAGQKSVVTSKFVSEAVEYVPRYNRPLVLPAVPAGMSCLVAGTMVWTDVGPRPVERIQLGDRVLSQDPATGELAYRAVLEPTVRPKAPIVVLKFGKHVIRATGGHPFWAVGRGWLMAREFEPGMRMYSVNGPIEVTAVELDADMPAYNLVVDEFHTYFVGDDLVLSHDNRQPEPTRGGVPGAAAR